MRLRTSRARASHEHVRLMTVGCRTQERGRAIHAMCTRVDRSKDMARPRGYPGSSVELGSGLGLSGQPKLVYYNMVWVAGRVGIGQKTPYPLLPYRASRQVHVVFFNVYDPSPHKTSLPRHDAARATAYHHPPHDGGRGDGDNQDVRLGSNLTTHTPT